MRIIKDGGSSTSLWSTAASADLEIPRFDTEPDPETEVCIVGAGIAGLTTALMLARSGTRVTVVDDGPIGGGETGRTSAHLTSAVDDRYFKIEDRFGERGAQLVAESHATAIDTIEMITRELAIDCDFRRVDGFLISPPGEAGHRQPWAELELELAAAQRAGLIVDRVAQAPLPFDTGPALRFARQAEFHPLKYLAGLARAVIARGGRIHTGVHVTAIESGVRIQLASDRSIMCRAAVDATNGAFTSPLKLTIRQAAYRSYVLAFAVPAGVIPHALFWDTLDPYHYIRVAPGTDGGELLIVGGADHRTGQGVPERAFTELETWTRTWLPIAGRVVHRWSGQILEPADGLAYIGKSPDLDQVYVVTGDSGEGLTHGTIAGLLISELVRGARPAWADLYDPKRTHFKGLGTLVKEAAHSSAPYTDWLRGGDVASTDEIQRGHGAIVRRGLHLIAAYRDDAGICHERSATCPHLRGVVTWNGVENTWDCPCHGSRFDAYGRVLNGPAASDLAVIDPMLDASPDKDRERSEKTTEPITQRTDISAAPLGELRDPITRPY